VLLLLDAVILAATALAAASALRPASPVAFTLAAYISATAELVVLAEVLSPIHAVDRLGYTLGELVFAAAAGWAWFRGGRPLPPPLPELRPALREHRVLAALAGVVAVAFAYQLFVAVASPPSNWDSMTYHLTRAAAWTQRRAVEYVPGAPTERANSFPPVAELQVLWTFVLHGRDTFAALPQLFAEAALTLAVYGLGRRLGWERAAAAFAALLVPTLTEVGLESVTTQNDLVVAAYVATAAYFALGRTRVDVALAGAAVGLAVGTKLTAFFALPAVVLLALGLVSRRRLLELAAASIVGIAALGAYTYVLNLAETGRPLGRVVDETVQQPHVTGRGTVATVARSYWRFLDLSGFHPKTKWVEDAGSAGRHVFRALDLPVNPPESTQVQFTFTPNVAVSEDVSFFGPLGFLLVVPLSVGGLALWLIRRADRRTGLLALALPLYVLGVALAYRYNGWLGRFYVTPVALTMPLAGALYRWRKLAAAVAALGALTLVLADAFNGEKPAGLESQPAVWSLTRPEAQALVNPSLLPVLRLAERLPPRIGAVLGVDDWSYPLYGANLDRRVVFLARRDALARARQHGLRVVLFGAGRRPLHAAGWRLRPVGTSGWTLAQAA